MNGFLRSTQFAFYLATPVERARAPFDDDNLLRPIPAATAHQITSVDTDRCVITLTSVRTLNAKTWISRAKSGWCFQIDQIFAARWFVIWIVWFQLEVISVSKKRKKMRNIQWMCSGRIGLWLKSIDLIRFLPVIFSTMLGSTANRISWYTVRTRCNIVRLQTVAVVMLNRILTVAVQTIAHHHTGRAIEAIFQIVAHQTEIRQTHPACFHRTRTGHTVTFALLTHFTLNVLKTEQKQKINRLIQHIYTYIRQCFD